MSGSSSSTRVAARVTGVVYRVEKQVGDPVRKEDSLALVEAAEVGAARSETRRPWLPVSAARGWSTGSKTWLTPSPCGESNEAAAELRAARIRLCGGRTGA